MISQETAARIWGCYREIGAAKKILSDMEEEAARHHDEQHPENLRDAFGRRRQLELGIPSGESSHRLFDVGSELAKSVIRAHIAEKQAALVAANEQARIELSSGVE